MQIGPRADVPEFNNAGRGSAPVDPADAQDPAVWAISCFFLRTRARGNGLTHRLVAEGIAFARAERRALARGLSDGPVEEHSRSIGLFVGSTRVFEKAGFARLVERKAGRPLMRYEL